ncbi:hypothetical protein [Nostoc sp. C057]|nr:hypothetical protein [Nostoc sp. C057]
MSEPQARRRLVLVASRGFRVALPSGATPCGWYRVIAHLRLPPALMVFFP